MACRSWNPSWRGCSRASPSGRHDREACRRHRVLGDVVLRCPAEARAALRACGRRRTPRRRSSRSSQRPNQAARRIPRTSWSTMASPRGCPCPRDGGAPGGLPHRPATCRRSPCGRRTGPGWAGRTDDAPERGTPLVRFSIHELRFVCQGAGRRDLPDPGESAAPARAHGCRPMRRPT
jgi:hypothetical protein